MCCNKIKCLSRVERVTKLARRRAVKTRWRQLEWLIDTIVLAWSWFTVSLHHQRKFLFFSSKYNMIIKADVSLVTLRIHPLERQINLLFIFNLIHSDDCLFHARFLSLSPIRFFSTRVKTDKFFSYCKSVLVADQPLSSSISLRQSASHSLRSFSSSMICKLQTMSHRCSPERAIHAAHWLKQQKE